MKYLVRQQYEKSDFGIFRNAEVVTYNASDDFMAREWREAVEKEKKKAAEYMEQYGKDWNTDSLIDDCPDVEIIVDDLEQEATFIYPKGNNPCEYGEFTITIDLLEMTFRKGERIIEPYDDFDE